MAKTSRSISEDCNIAGECCAHSLEVPSGSKEVLQTSSGVLEACAPRKCSSIAGECKEAVLPAATVHPSCPISKVAARPSLTALILTTA